MLALVMMYIDANTMNATKKTNPEGSEMHHDGSQAAETTFVKNILNIIFLETSH